MPLSKERIHYLLKAYISNQASDLEEKELMTWILEVGEDSELKSYMLDIWNQLKAVDDYSYVNWDEIYSHVMKAEVISIEPKIRRTRWLSLTAAAVILLALAHVGYLYLASGSRQPMSSQRAVTTIESPQKDISPPSDNKAVLTLDDGTKIEIGRSGNGRLAVQGNVQIIKQPTGEISYSGTVEGEVSYNTINVPRGSKPLNLILSDGSKVCINVGSSLTYPPAFTGKERKVKITGEAYFEVTHNAKMPFLVEHDDVMVRVLGTSFNLNSYDDEIVERVTLLKGSVLIRKGSVSQLLDPGQQVVINHSERKPMKIISNANLDEVMAWKYGKFRFDENTDIRGIMRQISRWYNVDIEYRGRVERRFWGSISKDENVSEVLKILEATGGLKFKVETNKIIVMPAPI